MKKRKHKRRHSRPVCQCWSPRELAGHGKLLGNGLSHIELHVHKDPKSKQRTALMSSSDTTGTDASTSLSSSMVGTCSGASPHFVMACMLAARMRCRAAKQRGDVIIRGLGAICMLDGTCVSCLRTVTMVCFSARINEFMGSRYDCAHVGQT